METNKISGMGLQQNNKKKTFEKGLGIEEGGGNEYGGRKHPN